MIKKGFSYFGVFFLQLLSFLPMWFLHGLARLLYYPLYYLVGYRKKVVRDNLSKSFPKKNEAEIIEIEKKFFKYFVDLIFETIKLASISKKDVQKRVVFQDTELITEYIKKEQSVLIAASHYGNWELLSVAFSLLLPCEIYTIYKPLSNPIFGKWFDKLRTRFGNHFIAMNKTLRVITETKNITSTFIFCSDQTPIKHDIQYNLHFLNQSTPVFLGLEKIALKTNRPVFYAEVRCTKRGFYNVRFIPLFLTPKETTNHQITDCYFEHLEKIINEKPEYWLWSHKRWKYAQQTNL